MNIYKEIKSLSEGEMPDYCNSIGDLNSLIRIFETLMSNLYLARINYQSVGASFTNLLLDSLYQMECVVYEIDKFECLIKNCWFYKKRDWSHNGAYKYMSFCDDMIGFCGEQLSSFKDWTESMDVISDRTEYKREEVKEESNLEENTILREQITVATVKEAAESGKIPHTPSQTNLSSGDSDSAKSTLNLANSITNANKQLQKIQRVVALNSSQKLGLIGSSEMKTRMSELNLENPEYLMYNDIILLNTSLNNLLSMRRLYQSKSVMIAGLILTGMSIVTRGVLKMMEIAKANHEENQEGNEEQFNMAKSDSCSSMLSIKTTLCRILNDTYNWLESCELDVAWWAAVKGKIQMSHLTRFTLHTFRICMVDQTNGIFSIYTSKEFVTLMGSNSKFWNKSSMISNLRFNIISNLIKFSYSDGNPESIDYCSMFELCRFFFYIFHSFMRLCCSFNPGQLTCGGVDTTVDLALDSHRFGDCLYNGMGITFREYLDQILTGSVISGLEVTTFFEKIYNYIRRGSFKSS